MNKLKVNSIKKSYGKHEILIDASFEANGGEIISVVGTNGCGKSTLLGIIAGTIKSNGGNIEFNDETYTDFTEFQQYVGFVPQENPLVENLSVYDNAKFWYDLALNKNLEEDFKSGILKEFGLDKYRKYTVSKLSGGLKKRLSIACTLALNPEIIIMDEPGAALDLACKEDIKKHLIKYRSEGKIIILTSHEEAELKICDRMYLLKNGTLSELPDKPVGDELLKRL